MAQAIALKFDPRDEVPTMAHLGFLQAQISRMGTHAFALKPVSITLTLGTLGFYGVTPTPSPGWALVAVIAITALWTLNAGYYRLERRFRNLYDAVIAGEAEPLSMNIAHFSKSDGGFYGAMTNWSVMPIHALCNAGLAGMSVATYLTSHI